MNMLILLLIAGACGGLFLTTRTRTAQISNFAKMNNSRFDREKDSITTELTAGRLEFFTQFFHQYQNVCTFSDNLAFIRVADDNLYTDDNPKTKPQKLTVFTAELKKKQFPALKIAPVHSPFASSQYTLMKTNIPEVDARYRIYAPTPASALALTPYILGLLKTRNDIYLELNDNALLYHEHIQIPIPNFQHFRFRSLQILQEFENLILQWDKTNPSTTATLTPKNQTDAEARAEAMIKALCMPQEIPAQKSSSWRGMWIFILMLALVGISLFSWFMLNNWMHRF